MRLVTNIILFLAALLTVVGLYVFRQQTFGGFQKQFGAMFGQQQTTVAKKAVVPIPPKPKPKATPTSVPNVEVATAVIPVIPRPPLESIQVGMEKSYLGDFGKPDVVTSAREGELFYETYIYLGTPAKATVVRLVNGKVAWVGSTRTVNPPLLVPGKQQPRARVLGLGS
jgi:hypothetical protein